MTQKLSGYLNCRDIVTEKLKKTQKLEFMKAKFVT